MRLHDNFEWDPAKAARNLRKHGVSFDDAARVLADKKATKYHAEEFDEEHSEEEDRYITTASHPDDREIVLVIAWTDRSDEKEKWTRIISARPATESERKSYGDEIART